MSSPDPEQEFKQRTKKKGNKIGKKRVREDEDGSDEGLKHVCSHLSIRVTRVTLS